MDSRRADFLFVVKKFFSELASNYFPVEQQKQTKAVVRAEINSIATSTHSAAYVLDLAN
jgi:hypothetical protein